MTYCHIIGTKMIEISNIQKKYKKKMVLQDISFTIQEGSCVGILGCNGCGKSTLLSILAGVQRGDEGEFLWQGKNLLQDTKLRAQLVGYVPQGSPLLEELTAWDNLLLWYDRGELKKELSDGVLSMLGIDEFIKTPVRKMSGGMKKRLSIGCSVARQPSVLLLDEASAALDLICKERIYNYLKDFKAHGGCILLTTHDVQELELCDKWYILKEGHLMPYNYDGNVHRLVGIL
ncbi:ABC transporter ATP-binding protein [Anaerocolumna xylanovorans]|uniref:ABC-2 type transport system ATP-binding protein n=1 Tax=Anaerocolumna xylanovorans DSM 12503 TaxID=1121345 RepID=A0A1M7Y7I2_9FIRM|nr:ABC transporter ATP-binding protein [Anaerocolumna xylanovorans]SHO48593.1 ABC-2 type transport system ATP-binding protein [Anaerocolumna xylanovorans DSM 12503]